MPVSNTLYKTISYKNDIIKVVLDEDLKFENEK